MTKAGRAAPRAAARWIAGPALASLVALSVLPAAASAGNSAASGGAQPTARVWGDVVSWDTDRPVAGATIRLPGYGAAVTSGADGTFAFPRSFPSDAPYRRIRVEVTANGYGRLTIADAPLYANGLILHAELRRTAYTERVGIPGAPGAFPHDPASAGGAKGYTCTGWDYQLVPPQKIWVFLTADGVAKQYDFQFYVGHVLPNEWISSWDADALGAGAIAAKTYAAYRAMTGHAYSSGTNCGDVRDTIDGKFTPCCTTPQAVQAVNATFGSIVYKGGGLFLSQYFAGSSSDPCAPVTGTFAGRMSQWGTQTCAKQGMLWPEIVDTFYDSDAAHTTWSYVRNLILNPSISSAGMWPWQTVGNATLERVAGTGFDGTWYIHVTPTVPGSNATINEERPFTGDSTTQYHSQVALRCTLPHNHQCPVTLKVIAVPATGKEIVRSLDVSVPGDGAWHMYTFDPALFTIVHAAVRFSVVTKKVLDVDAALLTASYGGP